jgi:peptide chain release factor 2
VSVSPRWGVSFDLPKKKARLAELEVQAADPGLWGDQEKASVVLRERSEISAQLEKIEQLQTQISDCETLLELYQDSKDQSLLEDCVAELKKAENEIEQIELAKMLKGTHDKSNAIMEINAGAGGTESQDWVEMLLRMYLRWAENNNYKTEILSVQPGEEAGFKHATVLFEGENATGFLRSEKGVHRMVRISPFDSNARRHTTFASVSVVPEIDDEVQIEIKDEDLRIDTYRAGGAGGQHINKTDSAVRLTHLPSGIVVACQSGRSQHKNKDTAMKLLKAKLYDLEVEKKHVELDKLAGERKKIDFGSQIRSYVMQPYQMVKDLRTNHETGNVQAVLDGEIEGFMKAYLLSEEWNR